MEKKETNMKDFLDSTKNAKIYWPYLIKLNQFTKVINNTNNFIRLGLTSENNLTIEYFKEEEPNNSFHKTSLNISEIHNLNDIFKSKKVIEEIYNYIYAILDKQNYEIKFSDDKIILVLLYDKNEINISLKKEKISFLNEYNYELNEFINKLYNEVLTLKKSLNSVTNIIKNNNEGSDRMSILMKENIDIMKKLTEIENENKNKQNEINSLKKTIAEIKNKNNNSKTTSKNYLKKQDIINNFININSNDEEADDMSGTNNPNPYFNYTQNYDNFSYNYYQDYINDINQNNDDINEYISNYDDYYYDNNNDYYGHNYESDMIDESENDINEYHDNPDYYNDIDDEYYNYDDNIYYNDMNQNIINNTTNNNKYKKNIKIRIRIRINIINLKM